jgi:N-dimethylarginine dimethylaminohydrolase
LSVPPSALNEYDPIRRIALRHVRDAFGSADVVANQWSGLNYTAAPDFDRAMVEYDAFAALLSGLGAVIDFLPAAERATLDSLYVRDATLLSADGLIAANMGKPARDAEPGANALALADLGLPVHGAITGDGRIEGGDVVWLDADAVAVAEGYRTNADGIDQFEALLGPEVEVIRCPLPHWHGPGDVFHLMSILSPLDRDLAVVHSPLMAVPFRQRLVDRGIELIEVAEDEFETQGGNVLAVAPRVAVMLAGNPTTRRRLERAGVEVHVFDGAEISAKGCGGPTCLTRPLVRDPAGVACPPPS